VRSQRFRLVNNTELYDIIADPSESTNTIHNYPEVVVTMRAAYDEWWKAMQPCLINEDSRLASENAFAKLYQQRTVDQRRTK
jgi:arylsulfatase